MKTPSNLIESLLNRPWLIIVFGYLCAVSAWIAMITLAERYEPRQIEIPALHSNSR